MSDGMGPSSLYEDENASTPVKREQESGAEDQDEGSEQSTVIPKTSLPGGTKIGDVISFRVTEDYGDEFGLEPTANKSSNKPSMMEHSRSEIAAMDETY